MKLVGSFFSRALLDIALMLDEVRILPYGMLFECGRNRFDIWEVGVFYISGDEERPALCI